MKFNPQQNSVVFALNMPTREGDLEIISMFSKANPTELVGHWKGNIERSYQIDYNKLSVNFLIHALKVTKQEAFIYISKSGKAYLADLNDANNSTWVGRFVKLKDKRDGWTYCPATQTYWKTLL